MSRRPGLTSRFDVHLPALTSQQHRDFSSGRDAVLVIDDTAIPKKGTHSVGGSCAICFGAGQDCPNCQTLVSLTLARGAVPVMLALRLFLPESWMRSRARLERAGVPAEYRTVRTKPQIALAEIDRAIAAGVRFGCVLADTGYGLSAPFRQGLTVRKLAWAVGIPRHLKVYPGIQAGGGAADLAIARIEASLSGSQERGVDGAGSKSIARNRKWTYASWLQVRHLPHGRDPSIQASTAPSGAAKSTSQEMKMRLRAGLVKFYD